MALSLPTPKPNKYALGFLFVTVLLDIIGLGIIIPVLPTLLTELTGKSVSEVAPMGGVLLLVYALMQFIMSPIIGGLSDRFGRRPVILLSLLGYSIDFMIMALAPTYFWLFLGRVMSGAFAATYATANAFIADISPPEKRAANFGLLGAAFGIGFIIGPGLGGWLGEIGPRVPFFVASGVAFINFVYGFFILPETLPKEKRRKFNIKRANPVGSLYQMRLYPIVLGVLLTFFLMQFSHNSLPAIWSYFAEEKFSWSPRDIGTSLMFVGFTSAIVQGWLTRIYIPKLGERRSVYLGITAMVISFLGYAFFTPTGAWVYLWIVVGAAGGFMMPAMQGLMSRATPEDAQGELQGAIASTMSITMITSPLTMTLIFSYFTREGAPVYFPGASFLAAAIILALCVIPFSLTMRDSVLRAKKETAAAE